MYLCTKPNLILMRFIYSILIILLLSVIFAFVSSPDHNIQNQDKMKSENCKREMDEKNELPLGYNELFAGSGECLMCHNDMTNAQGQSVSIISDWRSSMMANAARDPFWRAKVSHEGLVNPEHAAVLEDICSKCHAPMGNFNAHHMGQALYSIEDMENDPLAMDGVSCTACHQITPESLGNYSGNIIFGEDKIIWGPYTEPFGNPMINHTGYTPEYSPHIKDSKLCASCHTLLTNTVDLNGVPTGTEFVEQAVYQEWTNSSYPGINVSCQTCHVPEIDDVVTISTMPPWLEGRTPFGKHHLAGANVFMLKMLKQNIDELGVTATEAQMDSTISRAQRMLQENSVSMQLNEIMRTNDTLYVDLAIENMAGHKFPTAYPSRRAFVELVATDESGNIIFHSGEMDDNYNLVHEDTGFEPHYNMINENEKVQIYEMVMGNVNSDPTTILERAYSQLKDNRIPPQGFTTTFSSYDTVQIAGQAFTDEDFNKVNGSEGSGKDILHFHIPISGLADNVSITANIFYKTVTDKWLENMFTYSSTEIDKFKEYYNNADREPVLVGSNNLVSIATAIPTNEKLELVIFPNPSQGHIFIAKSMDVKEVAFYTLNGDLAYSDYDLSNSYNSDFLKIKTPEKKGIYLVEVKSNNGVILSDKIISN